MPNSSQNFENELYTGTMVQGKTRKINYKVKACQMIEPENWIRVERTHEPIISREVFETVQRLMALDTRTSPEEESIYVFSGSFDVETVGKIWVRRSKEKKENATSIIIVQLINVEKDAARIISVILN